MRSAGLAIALTVADLASAQEFDDFDIEIHVQPAAWPKSFWSQLFDNRVTRKRSFDYLSGGMPDTLIYFGGIDATQWGVGIHGAMQWMPGGPNQSGFILRMFMSESLERYTDRIGNYTTQIGRTFVLPGYMIRAGKMEVQLLVGPDAEVDFFFQNGRHDRWRSRIGMRGIADLWWEPTSELMVQYALSGTTIDSGYNTRIAAGWRLFDSFWVGPEAAVSSDYFSQQIRIGGHLTGLRVNNDYELSFAAGHVSDNLGRDGVYGRFGLMLRPRRAPFFDN